ncbi:type IX secretion system membrane protein PorP/SprF [Halosquirtibacter xylanolyticus]|uniref:PorP/SprF family type IX secretion system membrane protein n=1 Tax=Halosquirtibacter xylanolyticus TaxID=3374599 RepID=UPI003749991D|nr:type IX secretion system membrane protein PorP/SprF [Prolixibacteraceae bacterium]
MNKIKLKSFVIINYSLCFLVLNIITIFVARAQQDPQYSQYMFNMLTINPAAAGEDRFIDAYMLNRIQWSGFDGAPRSTDAGISAQLPLLGKMDGVGLNFSSDKIGYYQNVTVKLDYSYGMVVGSGDLRLGLSLGILNKQFKPQWKDPNFGDDPAIPTVDIASVAFDLGGGVYYKHKYYYLAASISHINQAKFPTEGNDLFVNRHYYFSAGGNLSSQWKDVILHPSILYKYDGVVWQLDMTAMATYKHRYWGGITYRLDDAIVVLGGIELRNGLRIGYSYDISTSSLSSYSSGSHEVYLSYRITMASKRSHHYKSVRFL